MNYFLIQPGSIPSPIPPNIWEIIWPFNLRLLKLILQILIVFANMFYDSYAIFIIREREIVLIQTSFILSPVSLNVWNMAIWSPHSEVCDLDIIFLATMLHSNTGIIEVVRSYVFLNSALLPFPFHWMIENLFAHSTFSVRNLCLGYCLFLLLCAITTWNYSSCVRNCFCSIKNSNHNHINWSWYKIIKKWLCTWVRVHVC